MCVCVCFGLDGARTPWCCANRRFMYNIMFHLSLRRTPTPHPHQMEGPSERQLRSEKSAIMSPCEQPTENYYYYLFERMRMELLTVWFLRLWITLMDNILWLWFRMRSLHAESCCAQVYLIFAIQLHVICRMPLELSILNTYSTDPNLESHAGFLIWALHILCAHQTPTTSPTMAINTHEHKYGSCDDKFSRPMPASAEAVNSHSTLCVFASMA